MPTNRGIPAERDPNRRPDGKFAPGNNANPLGRPRVAEGLMERIDQLTGDLERIATFLAGVLNDPEEPTANRMKAAEMLLDRRIGRPHQTMKAEVTNRPPEFSPDFSDDDGDRD